jgi:hypothetical protein
MDVEIHSVIHFLWLRGAFNEQIISQIKKTYGYHVIHFRSVQRSTHDSATGRTEFDALPRPEVLINLENADRIRELLESELYSSQKTLSRRLNLHHDTDNRIFTRETWVVQGQLQVNSAFLDRVSQIGMRQNFNRAARAHGGISTTEIR